MLQSLVRFHRGVQVLDGLALAAFEFFLAMLGGFGGAGSGLDPGFFDEVSPAGVAVFGGLRVLVFLGGGFRALLAPRDLNDASGLVGTNVVADDGVSGRSFVFQKTPVWRVQRMY